jgi:hypothetical protein
MTLLKKHFSALAVATLFIAANVRADEWNKRTVVTIDEPVQLPNTVLQPGTYVFKLLSSPSDRHIVQIFDRDDTRLITTILAIPNYRLQPKGKSVFTFWETPAGNPKALRAWFYPGDNFGQEFAYPKNLSTELAASNKSAVPTTAAQSVDDMKTAPVAAISETGQQTDLDTDTYKKNDNTVAAVEAPAPTPAPAPAPSPAAEPAPASQVAQTEPAPAPQTDTLPAELPHTAGQAPLIGLVGLVSLGLFLSLSRSRTR